MHEPPYSHLDPGLPASGRRDVKVFRRRPQPGCFVLAPGSAGTSGREEWGNKGHVTAAPWARPREPPPQPPSSPPFWQDPEIPGCGVRGVRPGQSKSDGSRILWVEATGLGAGTFSKLTLRLVRRSKASSGKERNRAGGLNDLVSRLTAGLGSV